MTLATGNKGGGPVVGRAYVGTACKSANYGVVNEPCTGALLAQASPNAKAECGSVGRQAPDQTIL